MRKKLSRTLCLSQIIVLSSVGSISGVGSFASPAFSLPSTAQADDTQLASYEKTLFGQAQPSSSGVETRLEALERNLFGQAKSGSTGPRLVSVGKALAGGKSDFLLPPLAPKYDFSHPSASSSRASNSSSSSASSGSGSSPSDGSNPMDDASKRALQQATTLYSQGRTDEAEAAFKHVLALNSKSTDAYFNLGVIAETRGDLQGALNNYQIASRINPGDSELHDAVTAVQSKISQKMASDDRARAQQQQASDLARGQQSQDNLKRIAADAQAAFKAGNFDRAISNLSMVAAQAPSDPDVQYALAQAYKGKGDLQSSRSALNRALALDPNNRLYQTAMSQLNSRSGAPSYSGGNSSAPAPGNLSNSYTDDPNGASAPAHRIPYTPYNSPQSASSSSPSSGWQSASADDGSSGASTGQLTPFTSQGESNLPGGGARRGGVSGSGFYYGTHGSSTKTRLTRAAIGAGTGLAFGAMMGGGGSHSRSRSMMTGALLGGAMGLFSGGW